MRESKRKPAAPTEEPETPCAPGLVQDLLHLLDKSVRLHQLYPATNATYLKSLDNLRTAFRAVWALTDALVLQVTQTQFIWYGRVVLDEPEMASDSLPWTFFKDGLRQLTLTRGFEEAELMTLLGIIPKVRRALDLEDDLLALLWEQEFEHLSYRFLDTVSIEGAPLDPSATPGRWPASAVVRDEPRAAVDRARRRAEATGTGALEAALRVAAAPNADAGRAREEAMSHLRAAIDAEYTVDLRCAVADALLDIFELQRDPAVRDEVVRHLDALTLLLLAARAFGALAHVLREATIAAGRAPAITARSRAGLAQLSERISDPALLTSLLEALDIADDRPSPIEVGEFLDRLGGRALGCMFQWGTESRHHQLRLLYMATAERLAASDPEELVKLLHVEQDAVALEVMRRCGVLKLESAVAGLVRELGHAAEARRSAALGALAAIATPGALAGAERALGDESAHVRTTAMKTLMAGAHRVVLPRVAERVKGNDARELDNNERRALFELYGTLCGDDGVPWLAAQLTGHAGIFRRRTDPETRACAAAALGRVNTPAARQALQRATGISDPLIRRAVNSALARETKS